VTTDKIIDGEHDTQGWNRFSYVHNNPIIYKDPTGHELVENIVSKGSPSWNVRERDTLSKVANTINKAYSMDVTVEDIMKYNPQIKNKDKIYTGDKIKLPFLHIQKGYCIAGTQNELTGSFLNKSGGEIFGGLAAITERKSIYNLESKRLVDQINVRTVPYKGKLTDGAGMKVDAGPSAFWGSGKFKNLDDAEKAFLGETAFEVSFYAKLSIGKQLDNYKNNEGRWNIGGVGFSFGAGKIPAYGLSTSSIEKIKPDFKFEDRTYRNTRIVNEGDRK
jgi:LysM repeat protein